MCLLYKNPKILCMRKSIEFLRSCRMESAPCGVLLYIDCNIRDIEPGREDILLQDKSCVTKNYLTSFFFCFFYFFFAFVLYFSLLYSSFLSPLLHRTIANSPQPFGTSTITTWTFCRINVRPKHHLALSTVPPLCYYFPKCSIVKLFQPSNS